MRFKSAKQDGFQVFAVAGVNTVSFGISAATKSRKGLLGFAIERIDLTENERYFMSGMKVFPSVIRSPDESTRVSTYDHPIQSFVWDDFTAKPGHNYRYLFYPLRGTPKNLDHSAAAASIDIATEEMFTQGTHDIFFNRGVASSQAYAREFHNIPPDKIIDPAEKARAFEWLSRQLDEALLKFVAQAKSGDELLACFYEFRLPDLAQALAKAAKAGVKLRLIVDAKDNAYTEKKTGKEHEAFPREDNIAMLNAAKIPEECCILRQMRPSNIQHNKFMVLRRKGKSKAEAVWTGSTNASESAIFGQTNVGHWVRDERTAEAFRAYWDILSADPGALDGRTPEGRAANIAFTRAVESLSPTLTEGEEIDHGITPIFSPRKKIDMLERYVALLSGARSHACITLAFGIGAPFRESLLQHDATGPLTFLLLEKEDRPNPRSKDKDAWRPVTAKNNVYSAFGSYLENAVYQFVRETNNYQLGFATHIAYIHSKFLLVDPLGDDPIIVTGSANFSEDSTTGNDENMIIIRGDRRVADIYFTEFNRLFYHYYYRSVAQRTAELRGGRTRPPSEAPQFLKETPEEWLPAYASGKLRAKRVGMFVGMAI